MEIYFNWLGEWIKIDEEEDNICGIVPSEFVEKIINPIVYIHKETEDSDAIQQIVQIYHENTTYYVPLAQLVWKITNKISSNIPEERW